MSCLEKYSYNMYMGLCRRRMDLIEQDSSYIYLFVGGENFHPDDEKEAKLRYQRCHYTHIISHTKNDYSSNFQCSASHL